MMQNFKMISMDFDGTLLTSDKKITEKTRKCLEALKDKYYIVGVTARNLLSVKQTLDIALFDYIILNNGSDIYYVKEDRLESISCIKKDIVESIYNFYKDFAIQIDFCTPYRYFMKTNEKLDLREFVVYINDIKDVNESISRINLFFDESCNVENYKNIIESKFDSIDVIKMIDTDKVNSRRWLTLNPKNTNKLNTLKKLCGELKCSIDEVIFFGDGENDLILIENVGLGVAMENAVDVVKSKASNITLSNDNDGIAIFLEKNLISEVLK